MMEYRPYDQEVSVGMHLQANFYWTDGSIIISSLNYPHSRWTYTSYAYAEFISCNFEILIDESNLTRDMWSMAELKNR